MLREFLADARESLDLLDQNIVGLERDPGNRDAIDNVLRSLHSLKGAAGFFEFGRVESIAHAGENLLQDARDGRLHVDSAIVSVLLAVLDELRAIIGAIERDGREPERDASALVERIRIAQQGGATPAAAPATAAATAPQGHAEEPTDTVRVDVHVLDAVMDLVGELVLSRNQILQLSQGRADAMLQQSAQQLDRITSELQERVMKTRMQPIRQVWSRLPRVVRDLSHTLGKQVRIEMVGQETELDRTLIDAIKDPLTHLVRNAVDHGIEMPDVRRERGKDPEGVFSLRAYHESGHVVIEVKDDGAGIDPDRIRAKALEKGIITAEQAAAMPAKDVVPLIFHAGFSTAEAVTNISGRGVGMDVVRSNIERLGGSIEVESLVGAGTSFRIKIPLTLAIIPALMVTCAGASYAIPQVNIVELARVRATPGPQGVEVVQGLMATRLRGRILRLVDLRELLSRRDALAPEAAAARAKAGQTSLHVVVLQANNRLFGLVVDGIEDSQEIVVKPLGRQVQDIVAYAGATILGDGRVALILDALGLAQTSGLLAADGHYAKAEDEEASAAPREDAVAVLLVQDSRGAQVAVPLDEVSRLEKVATSRIERVGDHEVMQYGDAILRLVRVDDVSPSSASAPNAAERAYVVVIGDDGASIGLVADRVLDIAETPRSALKPPVRAGSAHTVVLRGRVTEVLDIDAIRAKVEEASPHA